MQFVTANIARVNVAIEGYIRANQLTVRSFKSVTYNCVLHLLLVSMQLNEEIGKWQKPEIIWFFFDHPSMKMRYFHKFIWNILGKMENSIHFWWNLGEIWVNFYDFRHEIILFIITNYLRLDCQGIEISIFLPKNLTFWLGEICTIFLFLFEKCT